MRKKVRKSLAFLLALALVVSVMSGLGLSVSADEAQPQTEPAQTEEVQDEAVKETPKAEKSTPEEGEEEEEADPDAEAVPEEKKDVKKAEGEGSGDESPVKDTTADSNGEQKDEPQAEPAAEEQDAPVEQASVPIVQAATGKVSQYTITCGDQRLTVKLVDDSGNSVKGIAPTPLTATTNWKDINPNFIATVAGYTYSEAQCEYYEGWGLLRTTITRICYTSYGFNSGWQGYVCNNRSVSIANDTIYLVYTKPTFTIHYVDENGTEIKPSTEHERTQSVTFSDYADSISGYTYWRACYSNANNAEVTSANKSGSNYVFYNNDVKLEKPSANTGYGSREDINKLNDIYLVYVKQGKSPGSGGGTTGGGGSIQTPGHEKMAVRNDSDGTYDLSLSVSGSVGSSTQKAMVDIIYVLDMSNSMKTNDMAVTSDYGHTQYIKRLTAANNAIKTLTSSLTAEDSLIDARFALVTFSTHSSIKTFNGAKWTENGTVLTNALPSSPSDGSEGGTNYEAGLKNAKTLLDDTRQNATTVVIFLSDGVPTFYDTASGDIGGDGNSDNNKADVDGRAMSKARGIVKQMLPNYLFTVGVGDPKNYSNLGSVTGAAYSGVATDNYVGDNDENLEKAFDNMKGKITSIACQNVIIRDKLSANVAMVMADSKPKKLVGKVTDKDGNPVGTPSSDGKIALLKTNLNDAVTLDAPTYDGATRTFEWKFPDGYKLEADYTYTVTANVDVTETAFEHYRKGINENSNRYPDTPDAGTGTHANERGLFSNDNENAKLIYTVTGENTPKEVKYQKPVVKLNPSKLTIEKTVTGLDETALEQLKNNLKFKVTYTYADKTKTEKEISFKDFKQQNGGTYSYTSDTLDCWSMNATYTVEETGYNVEAYDRTGSGGTTVTRKIEGKNQNVTATFTNEYQHKNVTVTIKKKVTGNMSQTSDKFTFNVTNPSNLVDSDKSFDLSADDTGGKTISIPYGSNFTISETPNNGYTLTKVNGENVTGNSYTIEKVTENTTIIFTNTKQINPPNGIITTIAPYAIMVVLAAGAAVYFVYSRRRRNG